LRVKHAWEKKRGYIRVEGGANFGVRKKRGKWILVIENKR
jgi:hypothetical protein